MELMTKVSKVQDKESITDWVIRRFIAQDTSNPDPNQPKVDPNALQEGQSVYDQQGKEFVVLQNDPASTDKVIMPKDQNGATTAPTDVNQVQNVDLANNFKLQPDTFQGA